MILASRQVDIGEGFQPFGALKMTSTLNCAQKHLGIIEDLEVLV